MCCKEVEDKEKEKIELQKEIHELEANLTALKNDCNYFYLLISSLN